MKFLNMKLRGLKLLILTSVLWTAPAFGQGCAMCNASARSTPKEGQRALNRGVLVMLLPPVGFMVVGVALAFRYGKRHDEDQE